MREGHTAILCTMQDVDYADARGQNSRNATLEQLQNSACQRTRTVPHGTWNTSIVHENSELLQIRTFLCPSDSILLTGREMFSEQTETHESDMTFRLTVSYYFCPT